MVQPWPRSKSSSRSRDSEIYDMRPYEKFMDFDSVDGIDLGFQCYWCPYRLIQWYVWHSHELFCTILSGMPMRKSCLNFLSIGYEYIFPWKFWLRVKYSSAIEHPLHTGIGVRHCFSDSTSPAVTTWSISRPLTRWRRVLATQIKIREFRWTNFNERRVM